MAITFHVIHGHRTCARVCRRVPDPESWTDNRGTMEPSPFGDLFGEPQDIFAGDVRSYIQGLVRMKLAMQASALLHKYADISV